MTPSQYKDRYDRLQVTLDDGSTETVSINRYRLAGLNYKEAAKKAFESKLSDNGIGTGVTVNTPDGVTAVGAETPAPGHAHGHKHAIHHLMDWSGMAHYVFLGKGAPEHCQIVLQLARRWSLAPDLQKYADDNLGLDCNGFVGNYLWHVVGKQPWTNLGVGKHDHGPDCSIDGYFDHRKALTRWEDLNTSQSYLFGEVNEKSGAVIPGGSAANAGHIVITEPGWRSDPVGGSKGPGFIRVWVIEATHSHNPGLWASWYQPLAVDSKKRMFQLFRAEMIPAKQKIWFRVAPL